MKLRRRILKYFILLIILTSLINLAISYYLIETSGDRLSAIIRDAFLAQTRNNLVTAYETSGSFTNLNEAFIRPQELNVQLPRRWWQTTEQRFTMAVASNGGWDIVVADETGRIVLGTEKTALRKQPGQPLVSQDKVIGQFWLVPRTNNIWDIVRHYWFIPLLFRNFLTALISTFLALGIAFIFADYLARRLGELAKAAHQIAGGRLDYRVKAGAQDELGQLITDFNAMAEKLQQDQRLRRQLQTDVVHELRTPLSVCQVILDSLESGVINWDAKTLTSLQEETNRMNRLVTDLHELNRADNQQLSLHKELFTIGDLIERLADSFTEPARQKNIDFVIQAEKGTANAILYADPDRIMQIFLNILHNALRHTPVGGKTTLRINPQDKKKMVFTVANNGEGIPADILPHIFDRFYSGDKSRSRLHSGTGLGLSIAKEYVLLHGGDIEARSFFQQGAEFIVTLPVEQEEERGAL